MLPVVLAAALAVPPQNVTALRLAVWSRCHASGSVELFAEKLRCEAVALRKGKKPADALPLFNAAALLRQNDSDIRIGRAKTFAALGRYDEQADEYAWVLARNPYSYTTWHTMAEGWIDRGKWNEAAKCCEQAVAGTPPGELRSRIFRDEAKCWLGSDATFGDLTSLPGERLSFALGALDHALEPTADVSEFTRKQALGVRAKVRQARGYFAEAATDYDELLKLAPTDSEAHGNRWNVAFLLKDYTGALIHVESVERNGGDPVLVAHARCKTLLEMGEYERANRDAATWARLAPADQEAQFFHAITMRLCGNDDEADRVTASAAVQSRRTFAEQACLEVSAMWANYAQFDAAERLLTRLIANTPDTSELAAAYLNRGEARRQRRANEEALDDLTACVRLRPLSYLPRTSRAQVALDLRRYDIALEEAKALTRLWPFDPAGHKLLNDARSAIDMAAGIAGREPDYRTAGPLVTLPGGYSFGAELVRAYLPKR